MRMRSKNKFITLLLILAMIFSLAVPAVAAEVPGLGDVAGKLIILHVNDVHGRDVAGSSGYGTAGVAQLKKDLEAAGAYVLLVNAGDASQGTPLVNLDQGATAVAFMNAAGYDLMVPGNHEFDWGTQNLLDILATAEFPVLAANILYAEGNPYGGKAGELLFDANRTFEFGDLKVGVFGLDTPETATKTHPAKVAGTVFLAGEEMFAAAQEQVDALRAEGCDIVICVGHLGTSEESMGNRSIDLMANTTGIDLFIDGHSHTKEQLGQLYEVDGKEVALPIVSTGTALANIGVVIYEDGKFTSQLLGIADGEKAYAGIDAEIDALVNARNAVVTEELQVVIGKTDVLLYGKNTTSPPGVRVSETNMGDFATDALLWVARRELGEVDAAITNGGGIRDSISAGDITMQHMVTVFPFGNTLVTIEVTGAQLLDALEAATFSTPGAIGAFPQVSGMEFTIFTGVPYERGEPYGTYFMPANPGARVRNVTIGGEPLDLAETYTIATNDFTAAGGDTYGPFKGAPLVNTGIAMEQALIDYMTEIGVVGDEYALPQGRIAVIPADVTGWYTDAAVRVIRDGVMSTTGEGNFDGGAQVTRATVFQTLYNLEGKPATAASASFADIPDGAWYEGSAAWAEQSGLAFGTGDGNYDGERAITRQEIATILGRHLAERNVWAGVGSLAGFSDATEVASWATADVTNMVALKVITGKDGGRLDPAGTATRAELAQMLARYIDLAPKYTETALSIAGEDYEIPVTVTVPDGEGPFAAVVVNHGHGGSRSENGGFDRITRQLAEAGILSIRMDFPGCGDSAEPFTKNTLSNMISDSNSALAYLLASYNVDEDNLGIMGYSMGGTIALEILSAEGTPYTSAVLLAPAAQDGLVTAKGLVGGDTEYDKLYAEAHGTKGYADYTTIYGQQQQLSAEWFDDMAASKPLAGLDNYAGAMLVLNGDADTVVTPETCELVVKAYPAAEQIIVAGADHGYGFYSDQPDVTAAVEGGIVGFFARTLQVEVTGAVTVVDKYGNVNTDILGDKLSAAGFEPGDLLTVTIGGQSLEVPYGTNYSDVDTGNLVVRNPGAGRALIIAINMGDFGATYGVQAGDAISITMSEKRGYYAGFMAHQVKRTNNREDYASDEVFANFREVTSGEIGAGKLYRSSSPLDNEIGRAEYADKLMETVGIATVINLADNEAELAVYAADDSYDTPYYDSLLAGGNVIYLDMGVDFKADEFKAKLAEGLKFLAAQKGPYLVHCTEGKDRAGFAAALLEMLMGATAEEIVEDYMASFVNYYNVPGFDIVKGTEKYNVIGEGNILESVRMIAGLEKGASLSGVDLVKAATDYLISIGLTNAEINAIKANLK